MPATPGEAQIAMLQELALPPTIKDAPPTTTGDVPSAADNCANMLVDLLLRDAELLRQLGPDLLHDVGLLGEAMDVNVVTCSQLAQRFHAEPPHGIRCQRLAKAKAVKTERNINRDDVDCAVND